MQYVKITRAMKTQPNVGVILLPMVTLKDNIKRQNHWSEDGVLLKCNECFLWSKKWWDCTIFNFQIAGVKYHPKRRRTFMHNWQCYMAAMHINHSTLISECYLILNIWPTISALILKFYQKDCRSFIKFKKYIILQILKP